MLLCRKIECWPNSSCLGWMWAMRKKSTVYSQGFGLIRWKKNGLATYWLRKGRQVSWRGGGVEILSLAWHNKPGVLIRYRSGIPGRKLYIQVQSSVESFVWRLENFQHADGTLDKVAKNAECRRRRRPGPWNTPVLRGWEGNLAYSQPTNINYLSTGNKP